MQTHAELQHSCDPFDPDKARVRWPACPPLVIESIALYVNAGLAPGAFLMAVLANDLKGAIARADDDTLAHLRDIVGVIFNHIPEKAWGSASKVKAWLMKDGARD